MELWCFRSNCRLFETLWCSCDITVMQSINCYSLFQYPFKLNNSVTHYSDMTMGSIAFQITSLTTVYSIVYSDADQRKHQSSASLAFVRGIHPGPVNSQHKWPLTRKMFPFDDVIMEWSYDHCCLLIVGVFYPVLLISSILIYVRKSRSILITMSVIAPWITDNSTICSTALCGLWHHHAFGKVETS